MAKNETIKDVAVVQAQLSMLGEAPYALVFNKPRSANWPLVQEACRKFSRYAERDGLVFALFDDSVKTLKGLSNILQLVNGWNSMLFFVDGESEAVWRVSGWLVCYTRSFHAKSAESYCLKPMFSHAGFMSREQYLSPCRILSIDNITPNHPAPLVDQVHARAVEDGCFRCPNFNAENFRVYS